MKSPYFFLIEFTLTTPFYMFEFMFFSVESYSRVNISFINNQMIN